MDSPFSVLQERTNRLNQQYTNDNTENNYNLDSKFNNNDSSLNMTTIVRELEIQLDSNLQIQSETDRKIGNLEEDISLLLDLNRSQMEEIERLKLECEDWQDERNVMQETINECMEKVAKQRIYMEQKELEVGKELGGVGDRLASSEFLNDRRGVMFDELVGKYNELKEELESERCMHEDEEDRVCRLKSDYETKIRDLENEIVELNMGFIDEQKNGACQVQKSSELSQRLIASKNEEIDELKQEIDGFKLKLDLSLKEVGTLEKKIDGMEVGKLEFEREISDRHLEYFKQMECRIKTLTEQLEGACGGSVKKEEIVKKKHAEEIEFLNAENLKISKELESGRDSIEKARAKLHEIRQNMSSSLEIKEQIITGLNEERLELNEEIRRMQGVIDTVNGDWQRLDVCYRSELERSEGLEADVRRLKDEAGQSREKLMEEASRFGNFENECEERIATLQNDLLSSEANHATEIDTYKNDLKDLHMFKQLIPALELQFKAELDKISEYNRQKIADLQHRHQTQVSDDLLRFEVEEKSLGDKLREQVGISRRLDECMIERLEREANGMGGRQMWERINGELGKLKEYADARNFETDSITATVLQVLQTENIDTITALRNHIQQTSHSSPGPLNPIQFLHTSLTKSSLKRQLKSLEYSLQTEKLNIDDLKSQLAYANTTSLEYLQKLSKLKKETALYADQIADLKNELMDVKKLVLVDREGLDNNLSNFENDYLVRMAGMQREESRFSELEARTKVMTEMMLKKEIKNLNEDNSDLRVKLSEGSNQVKRLSEENSELQLLNSEMSTSLEALSQSNLQMKNTNESLALKKLDLQANIQTLSNQNSELRNTLLDRNLLQITNKSLTDKTNELQSIVQNLSTHNYELKTFITKMTLQKSISDSHREKFKKLYSRYLRSVVRWQALAYQKKFLLLVVDGYARKDDEAFMGGEYEFQNAVNRPRFRSIYSRRCIAFRGINRFRSAVLAVIAVGRMKGMVLNGRTVRV